MGSIRNGLLAGGLARMKKKFLLPVATACALAMSAHAYAGSAVWNNNGDAGNNNPPPAGAILDLNGQTINHNSAAPTLYTVDFSAAITSTAITFAFREDPAFIFFSDPSVTNLTTSSGNLLANSTFTGGTHTSNGNSATPIDWTYANQYGATFGGVQQSGCGALAGSGCWDDGAVQAYDAISQTIATTVGDLYQVSFYAWDNSGLTTFSDLSTNGNTTGTGGNGADILAYAQAGLPPPGNVPEPGALTLLAAGIAALGMIRRRRTT